MGTLHHQPDKDFIALSISSYVSYVKLPEGNLTHPYMNLEGLPGDLYPHFLHPMDKSLRRRQGIGRFALHPGSLGRKSTAWPDGGPEVTGEM